MAADLTTALFNTLLGMGTVFLVLIFISLIISLFKYIPAIQARMAKRREARKQVEKNLIPFRPAPKRPELPPEYQISSDKEEELSEELVYDTELVAVITAALLACLGEAASADKLVVKSIRRVKSKKRR